MRQISVEVGSAKFGPNPDDHHHSVCSYCGEVRDVYVAEMDLSSIEHLGGFTVDSMEIVFRGRYATCQLDAPSVP